MARDLPPDPEQLLTDAASIRELARDLVADRHLADDVAQDAFLSVISARSDHVERRGAWLKAVVRNAARMVGRGAARRADREAQVAARELAPSTEEILEREDLRRAVIDALLELDEPYRTTLVLRYLEELPLGIVAKRLGVEKETIRTRCRRGLEILKPRLRRAFGGSAGTGRALALLGAPMSALPMRATNALDAAQELCPPRLPHVLLSPSAIGAYAMKLKLALSVALAAALIVAFSQLDLGGRADSSDHRTDTDESERTKLASVAEEPAREAIDLESLPASTSGPATSETTGGGAVDSQSTRGGIRVRTTWSDGTPAAGVSLLFRRSTSSKSSGGPSRPFYESEWIVTSDDGIALLDERWPGKFRVDADRGGELEAEIVAGEVTEEVLVLDGTYDIVGLVVDEGSRPVAGARVFSLSWRSDWTGAREVATSDANGRFRIRAIDDERSLGATAAGHGPSDLVDIKARAGLTEPVPSTGDTGATRDLDVTLVLTGSGAVLTGTVATPDGVPVEGAVVAVELPRDRRNPISVSGIRVQWRARNTVTDAKGSFRLDGLSAGTRTVSAFHVDWPLYNTSVDLDPQAPRHVDVVFSEPAWIFGVASFSDGTPAANADVLSLPEPFVDPFPKQGPTELGSPFKRPRAQASADGSYEIGPLAPGEVHLHASHGTSSLTPYRYGETPEYRGTLQASFEVLPGDRIEWNPRLSMGASIKGRVLFADGSPIADAFVSADLGNFRGSTTRTDTEGHFLIPNLKPSPHRVHFQLPFSAPSDATAEVLYDIVPSENELVLSADYSPSDELEDSVTILLRLADDGGLAEIAAPEAVAPMLSHMNRSAWSYLERNEEGVYKASVSPGQYRVSMRCDSATLWMGEVFEVRTGETRDLGTIHTERPGTVQLLVSRPAGFDGEIKVRAKMRGYMDSPQATIPKGSSACTLENVVAGRVPIEIRGSGIASELIHVDVVPGGTVEATAEPSAGYPIELEVDLARRRGFRRVDFRLFAADGREVASQARNERHIVEWPMTTTAVLAPGTYSAKIETTDGQRLEETVTIAAEDPPTRLRLTAQ